MGGPGKNQTNQSNNRGTNKQARQRRSSKGVMAGVLVLFWSLMLMFKAADAAAGRGSEACVVDGAV